MAEQEAAKKLAAFQDAERAERERKRDELLDRMLDSDEDEDDPESGHSLRSYHPKSKHLV